MIRRLTDLAAPSVAHSFPLTSNQQRYVLASLTATANYHLPVTFRLTGPLDVERLVQCIHQVVETNEGLNVSLERTPTGEIVNIVHDQSIANVEIGELLNADDSFLTQSVEAFALSGAEVLKDHLCKFQILRLGSDDHCFTFSFHHAIADGVTIGLFIEALTESYNGSIQGHQHPMAAPSFFEVAQKYHLFPGQWSEQEASYWTDKLSDVDDVAVLPADRDGEGSFCRKVLLRHLSTDIFDRVRELAKSLNVSPFHVVYASYLIVLGRSTGADQLLSTFQSSGRRGKPEARKSLGPFSNALVLKSDLDSRLTFTRFVQDLRDQVYASVDHERFPYHEVIRRTGVHPSFGINWYPTYGGLRLRDVAAERLDLVPRQSDYDLNLHCLIPGDRLTFKLHYDPNRSSEPRMTVLLEQVEGCLRQIVEHPEAVLGELQLATSRDHLLPDLRTSATVEAGNSTIHQSFFSLAEQVPQRTALQFQHTKMSYGQLSDSARAIATDLISKGFGSGTRIAILADRRPALVVSMLGVLASGGSFAVFDREYPEDRLRQFCELLDPAVLIDATADGHAHSNLSVPFVLRVDTQQGNRWCIQDESPGLARRGKSATTDSPDFQQVAYYLFTSGTTGTPRCVAHGHAPLLHFVKWHVKTHEFDKHTRFALLSGLSHDPVLRDIFTPLLTGATCYIPSGDQLKRPAELWKWLCDHRVHVLHVTPQLTKLISMGGKEHDRLSDIQYVFWGGDVLELGHAKSFLKLASNAQGVNFYGATETPQVAGHFVLSESTGPATVPVGVGIDGTQLLVVNSNCRRVGFGEIGQIAVASRHLSLGYTDISLNEQAFVSIGDPEQGHVSGAYLTGDYGYYAPSGDVFFLGRRDQQVKIRGHRVEPAEVVRAIESIEGVDRAVVTPLSRPDGEQVLVAYYVKRKGCRLETVMIDRFVAERLPAYMQPSYYVEVDAIPTTPNGKLDRSRLPHPDVQHVAGAQDFVAPETELESKLAEEFQEILGIPAIGVDSSFNRLGGDSLSYISASMVLEKELGELPAHWERLTIRQLARLRKQRDLFTSVEVPVLIRAIAICAIVAGHFGLTSFPGATGALFLVAGHSFARFQISTLQATRNIDSIVRLIIKIFIPTALYATLLQLVCGGFFLSTSLLVGNYFSPDRDFTYWFVAVLIQNLLILAGLFAIPPARDRILKDPFRGGLVVLAVSYALRLGLTLIWDTNPIYDRVPHIWFWYVILGWCIALADTRPRMVLVSLISVVALTSEWWVVGSVPPMVIVAMVLILTASRVRVPIYSNRLINEVAGASLFIYLTHTETRNLLIKLGFEPTSWFHFFAALVVAIACCFVWTKLVWIIENRRPWTRIVDRLVRRPLAQSSLGSCR